MKKSTSKKQKQPKAPKGCAFRGQRFTSAYSVLFRMAKLPKDAGLTDKEIEYAQELADLCPADEGVLFDQIIANNTVIPQEETE